MQVTAIKTHKITENDTDILTILDKYLICYPERSEGSKKDSSRSVKNDKVILKDKSILAISSKIVAITEGSILSVATTDKDALVERQADMYLPRSSNKYGVSITIKNGMFIASSGIDESNGNGNFVLWPKDPQASANRIREHLVARSRLDSLGVIITDSRLSPLRWGVTGVAIAHSGFAFLKSYVGEPDVFGRKLRVEKVNVADTLAAAAVGVMGEGNEQTPLAIITDANFVHFQERNPTEEELRMLHISPEDDAFAGLLTSAQWIKGH